MSDVSRPDVSNAPTEEEFRKLLVHNLYHTHGSAIQSASLHDAYMALSYTVRDYLIGRWRKTTEARYQANPKYTYYLSAEYLLGKQLPQNLQYTGTTEVARNVLAKHNVNLDDLLEMDVEPGLGNGGLGRLAACFIDSLATMDVPATGYGIRYEFGIFQQTFDDGWQKERPDEWSLRGNPWEFVQSDELIKVGFGGHTEHYNDADNRHRVRWIPETTVLGEPCTMLVPGYQTQTVNILRLWQARASEEFDFQVFDQGDYDRAVWQKVQSENLSKVLYPNDETQQGKDLRLKQQYFFVSCSLRDIIRRFHIRNSDWSVFPDKVAIQLNDTHPVIGIPELMRILVDENQLDWEQAWQITQATFAYTCHTLLPEALETWPVSMFRRLLPRHLEIIYEINHRFLEDVRQRFPNDEARVSRMSIIENGDPDRIRMAHLATIGSSSVNGVAELQSKLLRERTLRDFAERWPGRFQNKTNGVTPRRFIQLANPGLAELITSSIGSDEWLTNLERISELERFSDNPQFREQWRDIKQQNKSELATLVADQCRVDLDVNSLFDVMVKRLHEYKRQLLKVMHIIWLYQRIKENPSASMVPRTFVFGAKAAPGYHMAKRIIKLIHGVAEVVNHDSDVDGRLRVVFPANYNVSLAEKIYPSADVSEQISLAGKEASGTGNMKLALNGAVTVGTLDGANVEIRDLVGAENFFLFGLTTDQVFELKQRGYNPWDFYHANPQLQSVLNAIGSGQFARGDSDLYRPIVDSLMHHDQYLLLADFQSYVEASEQAADAYQDVDRWTRMAILNAARCGFFSSDRSMREYCADIWHVSPVQVS